MEVDRGHDDAAADGSASPRSERRPPPSFDCNICLDTVSSPIVTLCGHLYWCVARRVDAPVVAALAHLVRM
jgi:hypothetical protein